MNHGLTSLRLIRGALAGVALASVLLVTLAGGLHVHGLHAGDDCELCLHLHNLSFDVPSQIMASTPGALERFAALDSLPACDRFMPGDDPARAPPFLS